MTPTEAARLLNITLPTTEQSVRQAFSAAILHWHPDVFERNHPDRKGEVGPGIANLKQARDVLVDHTRGVKPACYVCGGDGQVLSRGFKAVPCPKGCKRPPLTRQAARRKS